jgi:hypothetical protein
VRLCVCADPCSSIFLEFENYTVAFNCNSDADDHACSMLLVKITEIQTYRASSGKLYGRCVRHRHAVLTPVQPPILAPILAPHFTTSSSLKSLNTYCAPPQNLIVRCSHPPHAAPHKLGLGPDTLPEHRIPLTPITCAPAA